MISHTFNGDSNWQNQLATGKVTEMDFPKSQFFSTSLEDAFGFEQIDKDNVWGEPIMSGEHYNKTEHLTNSPGTKKFQNSFASDVQLTNNNNSSEVESDEAFLADVSNNFLKNKGDGFPMNVFGSPPESPKDDCLKNMFSCNSSSISRDTNQTQQWNNDNLLFLNKQDNNPDNFISDDCDMDEFNEMECEMSENDDISIDDDFISNLSVYHDKTESFSEFFIPKQSSPSDIPFDTSQPFATHPSQRHSPIGHERKMKLEGGSGLEKRSSQAYATPYQKNQPYAGPSQHEQQMQQQYEEQMQQKYVEQKMLDEQMLKKLDEQFKQVYEEEMHQKFQEQIQHKFDEKLQQFGDQSHLFGVPPHQFAGQYSSSNQSFPTSYPVHIPEPRHEPMDEMFCEEEQDTEDLEVESIMKNAVMEDDGMLGDGHDSCHDINVTPTTSIMMTENNAPVLIKSDVVNAPFPTKSIGSICNFSSFTDKKALHDALLELGGNSEELRHYSDTSNSHNSHDSSTNFYKVDTPKLTELKSDDSYAEEDDEDIHYFVNSLAHRQSSAFPHVLEVYDVPESIPNRHLLDYLNNTLGVQLKNFIFISDTVYIATFMSIAEANHIMATFIHPFIKLRPIGEDNSPQVTEYIANHEEELFNEM
uniref:BZIP domain-containing protein n=1 Tax=Rhabditophanes sp. KR3021 TaxID=114890 RepID=A0AC35U8I7_9BILA